MKQTNEKIQTNLMNLIQEGHLNVNVKLLQTPDSKLGKFRVLCKLHKLKFGLRPIISCIQHQNFVNLLTQ